LGNETNDQGTEPVNSGGKSKSFVGADFSVVEPHNRSWSELKDRHE
jgi:hypothetical protein